MNALVSYRIDVKEFNMKLYHVYAEGYYLVTFVTFGALQNFVESCRYNNIEIVEQIQGLLQ